MIKPLHVFVILVVLISGSLWYRIHKLSTLAESQLPTATSTVGTTDQATTTVPTETPTNNTPSKGSATAPLVTGKKNITYTNFNYGFSVTYPENLHTEFPFRPYYLLGKDWRAGATPLYRGTPIISFVIYREDNNTGITKKYPLYFSTEVRVGVTVDVANCYKPDAGYTAQQVKSVTLNGTTWKVFSFANAGMMQYVQGESYRTIHNKQCYVVEQVKTGSNYRDQNTGTGTPDTVLNNEYALAGKVLKTFRFIK